MNVRRITSAVLLRLGRGAALATLLLLLLHGIPTTGYAAQAPRLNAAGLVVKHGDGSVLYFYVQFKEPEITGTQLLERAGVTIDVAPYAGIGQAVCRIDGEGCPSSNCFCKSYSNPSIYWRYHKLGPGSSWLSLPYGPDQRTVHDGDVDGWSWSAQDNDLPQVTLDQIARINGITVSATPSAATATPAPAGISSPRSETRPTATPAVVGVEVEPSGQTASVQPGAPKHSGGMGFVWFGLGVAVVALVGSVVVVRRRRDTQ